MPSHPSGLEGFPKSGCTVLGATRIRAYWGLDSYSGKTTINLKVRSSRTERKDFNVLADACGDCPKLLSIRCPIFRFLL